MEEETLELEAEKANGYAYYGKPLGKKYLAFNEGFIAGATSKWIEKQKLEFAIDVLYILRCSPHSELDVKKKSNNLNKNFLNYDTD